jgi:hypothetical protein
MKTLKVFVLLTACTLVISEESDKTGLEVIKKTDFAVAEAIKGMLNGHFAVREHQIDLFYCGWKSRALAEKVLREKPIGVTVGLFRIDEVSELYASRPSIVLFDSGEDFKKFGNRLKYKQERGALILPNILFFVPKRGQIDVVAYYANTSFPFVNTNFIQIVNETTVDLVTNFKFESGKCGKHHYKTINRFSTSNLKWENETFYPEKFNNYHGCELKVQTVLDLTDWELNVGLGGRSTTTDLIFGILAQKLNFHQIIVNTSGDLIHLFTFQSKYMFDFYDTSLAISSDYYTLTVPTGEPYTQLEKMFLMFDKETWICIGVTIAGALLIIQIINFTSVKVQKFVFGRDVRTPTLNVASIFLSGGQARLPGKNFARFILMMFIIWSLIIRTCYQSILYKNLQLDMRRPRIQTIDELNEKNFTIAISDKTMTLHGDEFISRFEAFLKRDQLLVLILKFSSQFQPQKFKVIVKHLFS